MSAPDRSYIAFKARLERAATVTDLNIVGRDVNAYITEVSAGSVSRQTSLAISFLHELYALRAEAIVRELALGGTRGGVCLRRGVYGAAVVPIGRERGLGGAGGRSPRM